MPEYAFQGRAALPSPRCSASCWRHDEPVAMKLHAGMTDSPSFARRAAAAVTSTPTVKSALMRPALAESSISGWSVSSFASRDRPREARPRSVLPPRPSSRCERQPPFQSPSSKDDPGSPSRSETGFFASRCRATTRRLNTCVIEFVVTKPKRLRLATSPQYRRRGPTNTSHNRRYR